MQTVLPLNFTSFHQYPFCAPESSPRSSSCSSRAHLSASTDCVVGVCTASCGPRVLSEGIIAQLNYSEKNNQLDMSFTILPIYCLLPKIPPTVITGIELEEDKEWKGNVGRHMAPTDRIV